MSIEFWITSLVVVLVPGTGVIYTVSAGITGGLRKSLWAAGGCTLGILPHVVASLVGVSALLHSSAVAFSVLKYAGVAYLLFLAWRMWRDKAEWAAAKVSETRGGATFRKAFLMNILNPKLTIFFLAFLPQFVSVRQGNVPLQMVVLSLCFMALTLVVFVLYGLVAHSFRELLVRSPRALRVMNRTFAGVLGFFGVQLALSDR